MAAGHVLLLSDYDGTLAPIAPRPELAVIPERTWAALQAASRRANVTAGVVSGRSLADVSNMVGLPGLIYAGNHGLEIRGEGLDYVHPEALTVKPRLESVREILQAVLGRYEGVLVEGKGLTLSVHCRLTPEEFKQEVVAEFDRLVKETEHAGRLRVTRGKEVLEVRPDVPWDKGKAITRIASNLPAKTLAIYFGDDATDEDGFAAVHELDGVSVFVGGARQPTRALYRVDCPAEVATALELMAGL